jgi:hypothetical protein
MFVLSFCGGDKPKPALGRKASSQNDRAHATINQQRFAVEIARAHLQQRHPMQHQATSGTTPQRAKIVAINLSNVRSMMKVKPKKRKTEGKPSVFVGPKAQRNAPPRKLSRALRANKKFGGAVS